jgi:hypothetical protein
MDKPRPTNPTPTAGISPSWNPQQPGPGYSMQPKKKSSKAWVWVLGIFAVLILVCGGGFAGFFYYVVSNANSNFNLATNSNKGTNTSNTKANTFTKGTPTASPATGGDAKEIALAGWVEDPSTYLETQFQDGEFFMTSKQKNYYYVLVAKDDDYKDANVARVSVRNPDNIDNDLGYGLVFHSDITPLTNDYAFLIDTKRRRFRVVRHESSQEKTVTAWTSSNLIKQGSSDSNLLEARDKGEKIELYLNGQLATTITSKGGPKGGVPGLYVGDGGRIGFKGLEVVN